MVERIPSVQSLDRPEAVREVLRKESQEDCLGCKVVGSGAFFGLAAYSYFSGMSQLEQQRAKILQSKSMFGMRSRKFGIGAISFGLFWMGLWRAIK